MTAMSDFGGVLHLAAIAAQGVFLGSNLAEGCVLLPYWLSLGAPEFFAWYRANDRRLLRYFTPVTALAALSTLAAAVTSFVAGAPGRVALGLAALASLAYTAMFPLYFARANAGFSAASIPADRLPAELARWARWHWVRTGVALAALGAALWALEPAGAR